MDPGTKKKPSLLQQHRRWHHGVSTSDSTQSGTFSGLTIGTTQEKPSTQNSSSNLLSPKQRQALASHLSQSHSQHPNSASSSNTTSSLDGFFGGSHHTSGGITPSQLSSGGSPTPGSLTHGSNTGIGNTNTASGHASSSDSHGMDPLLLAIHEYLLYTGLSSTSSTLLKELKQSPPLPYHQTSKLVSLLLNHIHQFQFSSLLQDWNLLAEKFQFPSAESLQMKFSLVKYYFVVCIKKWKLREMETVLRDHAWWIHRHEAFRDWFALPFLMRSHTQGASSGNLGSSGNIVPLIGSSSTSLPSSSGGASPSMQNEFDFQDVSGNIDSSKNASYLNKIPPSLKVYFDAQWIELLSISLHNFLQTSISKSKQKPHLMRMEKEYERKVLRLEKSLVSLQRDNHILERKMNAMYDWIRTRAGNVQQSVPTSLSTSASYFETSIPSDCIPPVTCHQPQEILIDHRGTIDSLKFSYGGLYLATASSERGILKIYSSSSNHKSQTYDLYSSSNGEGSAGSPVSSGSGGSASNAGPDSSSAGCTLEWNRTLEHILFAGLTNRKIKVFDINKKRKISTLFIDAGFPRVLNISSNPVQQNCIAVSSVPQIHSTTATTVSSMFSSRNIPSPSVSSSPSQGLLSMLDSHTGQLLRKFPKSTPILHASYNHNGKLLAVASVDGTVRILDPNSPSDPIIMKWEAHSSQVTRVFFSCDETTLWSCGSDGKVKQWNMHRSGDCIREEQVYTEGNPISITISPGEVQGNSFLSSTGVLYEEQNQWIKEASTEATPGDDVPLSTSSPAPTHSFTSTHRFQIDNHRCVNFSCIDWNPAENLIASAYKNRTYVYSAPFVYRA